MLGIEWKNQLYIDAALTFGLRSAPKIFNALADALEWIVKHHGVDLVWYYAILQLCEVPLAEEKLGGPATILAILGIELDTDELLLRLPPEKLARLWTLLEDWMKKKATKCDLKSSVLPASHPTPRGGPPPPLLANCTSHRNGFQPESGTLQYSRLHNIYSTCWAVTTCSNYYQAREDLLKEDV